MIRAPCRIAPVPVDGFRSISVYNAEGYYEKNPYGAYTLNNLIAKKDQDGSVTIRFGGCDGKVPNCLPMLELHGAALPPARRDIERHMEVSGGAFSELSAAPPSVPPGRGLRHRLPARRHSY